MAKAYVRGQDIKRWSLEWAGLWMIFTRRGIDIDAYPAIYELFPCYNSRMENDGLQVSKTRWCHYQIGHHLAREVTERGRGNTFIPIL